MAADRALSTKGPAEVGSLDWERAGGPPLSLGQRLSLLRGAAALTTSHFAQRLGWSLGFIKPPALVDLAKWAPPDSKAAREAEDFLRAHSSPAMAAHSHRTYFLSCVAYETSGSSAALDREVLYVAALLHDVGLFLPDAPGQRCFTVGGAREARRIAEAAGWTAPRQDSAALAIMTNLNPEVSIAQFGAEAHFMRAGGLIEVIAQEWKVHPRNLDELLARHPRTHFATDSLDHVHQEIAKHPGCRFACLNPLFPLMVKHSRFSRE